MVISGNIVDVLRRTIYKGRLYINNGKIVDIQPSEDVSGVYILPGLIDSHVHVESSMVSPARFAQEAVRFGVVAAVADPHEIANVCGIDGVRFMVDDAKNIPFKFYFGAPSCVPATPFDSSGASLDGHDIEYLFDNLNLKFLAEVMNFPGVVQKDSFVIKKIHAATERGLPIDGHAPMLTGAALEEYVRSGIETDHECTTLLEAEEKLNLGMKILIREGSASQNFNALFPLIDLHPDHVMICTDDCHPESLTSQYLNRFIPIGRDKGLDFWNILQALTINPVAHYKLNVGLLRKGDPADFIVVDNLYSMNVIQTWVDGNLAFDGINSFCHEYDSNVFPINYFNASPITINDVAVRAESSLINAIQCIDKQIYTDKIIDKPRIQDGFCLSDINTDLLKIVVLNRYKNNPKPAVGFIKGFGIKSGAIATTISHDSHNIVAVGVTDTDIVTAINKVIESKGGICFTDQETSVHIPLPIAGLMSFEDAKSIGQKYETLQKLISDKGCTLSSPIMTLSFMSLLVIPKIKISDKGLFDVEKFQFVNLFIPES